MDLLQILKEQVETIYTKYFNEQEEVETLPIYYIAGSQTLPPPLLPEEEEESSELLSLSFLLSLEASTSVTLSPEPNCAEVRICSSLVFTLVE